MTDDELVAALHAVDGLVDKGKVHPAFYLRSRPFLHFHGRGVDRYADVRFGDDWEQVPSATPSQRRALLRRVEQHVAERRR